MITPSFSPTATERVLPKLALDFTTASLDSRVTLTRALNTATAVNSSGNVAIVNANLPRFDYDPTTLACKGLLIEESRVNSVQNNTMVGAVAGTPGTIPTGWTYISTQSNGLSYSIIGTGTENGISYLDVRFNGTTVNTNAISIGIDAPAALTGQSWAASTYWKLTSGTTTGITAWQIGIIEQTSGGGFVAGAFYSQTAPTSSSLITQRPSATRTLSGGATVAKAAYLINISVSNGTAIDFTIRIGMPQFEQGAFATSVIPTSGTVVTRNADVATMTGTNFSSWFNATQGSFSVTGSTFNPTTKSLMSVDDGTSQNRMTIRRNGTNASGNIGVTLNVTQWNDGSDAGSWTINTTGCDVFGYKLNDIGMALNGAYLKTDNAATIPTVNILRIGDEASGLAGVMCGYVKKIFYWPQKLTNAEITAFSKG